MRTGHTSTSVKVGVSIIANILALTFWFVVSAWVANTLVDPSFYDDTGIELGVGAWILPGYWSPFVMGFSLVASIIFTAATWMVSWAAIYFMDSDKRD